MRGCALIWYQYWESFYPNVTWREFMRVLFDYEKVESKEAELEESRILGQPKSNFRKEVAIKVWDPEQFVLDVSFQHQERQWVNGRDARIRKDGKEGHPAGSKGTMSENDGQKYRIHEQRWTTGRSLGEGRMPNSHGGADFEHSSQPTSTARTIGFKFF